MKIQYNISSAILLLILLLFGTAASGVKNVVGPGSSVNNALVVFDGTNGFKIKNASILVLENGTISNGVWYINPDGSAVFSSGAYTTMSISNLTVLSNFIVNAYTTLKGAYISNEVRYGQSELNAHSSITNFVVDPTINQYQTINLILTNSFANVRFIHATNSSSGRQCVVQIYAGTNSTVRVDLSSGQFLCNTNFITLSSGQMIPVSFKFNDDVNTNCIATLSLTPYTRQ